jgi:hypothetical protein
MPVRERTLNRNAETNPDIDRTYHDWDEALPKNDVTALVALYAKDAELQSLLVCHLMNIEIENGLIQKHRVYWGWFGFNVLKKDAYRR